MRHINFSDNKILVRSEVSEMYRKEMAQYKPLDEKVTIELYAKYKEDGDETALNQLVCANLRIVWSIAKAYANIGLPFEDVLQEGNVGLIMAFDNYDPSKGKLSTHILEYVRKYITIGLTDNVRTVRMYYKQIQVSNYTAVSMDATLSDEDGDKTICDTFASASKADEALNERDTRDYIYRLLNGLSEREKAIVCALFGFATDEVETEYTLAQRFGLTEERIRQIKWEAIKKMKELAKGKKIK